ncbi:hypothetical protein [Brevundimonas sp.]|uniref:hypothetical protein n=1 Tax=Brevundimonas sp. TaxID=1871086 RepID=UPI00286CF575|nr:hypothetical protein [Brevundimonas sp.]
MSRQRIKPSTVAVVLAAAGFAATTLTAAALALPHTDFAAATGLAPVFERRADALAQSAATDETARARAILETRRSLAQAPANPTAWLRLAYLDSVSPGGLSGAGDRALAASYAVAPYGPDVTDWRLAFAFNHWSVLSDESRKAALDEFVVTSAFKSHRDLEARVSDPSGRLALALTLDTIAREKAPQPQA